MSGFQCKKCCLGSKFRRKRLNRQTGQNDRYKLNGESTATGLPVKSLIGFLFVVRSTGARRDAMMASGLGASHGRIDAQEGQIARVLEFHAHDESRVCNGQGLLNELLAS